LEGKHFVAGCAILTLGALGSVALYKNINGVVLTSVVGAITFIAGLCFGVKVIKQ